MASLEVPRVMHEIKGVRSEAKFMSRPMRGGGSGCGDLTCDGATDTMKGVCDSCVDQGGEMIL